MNNSEDIRWVDMGDTSSKNVIDDTTIQTEDFNYAQNIKEHITPINYMNPYNPELVEVSKCLYGRFLQIKGNNSPSIIDLSVIRKESVVSLGVLYDSATFYKWLMMKYSPDKYIEPYDEVKFNESHIICTKLTEAKDDFSKLEDIWIEEIRKDEKRQQEELEHRQKEEEALECERKRINELNDKHNRKQLIILAAIILFVILSAIVGSVLSN